jgi:hypothetical protein
MLGLPLAHLGGTMAPIEMLMQVAAGTRDTVLMRQIAPERSTLDQITAICGVIITLAWTAFAIVAVPAAWRFRGTYKKANELLDRLQNDIGPIARHATSISDNINYITTALRADVGKVQATIDAANDRVQQAAALTEERLNEFNALLAVVQQEAEDMFVSTASAVRGVRTGAAAFHGRDGMDFASDDLDSADLADELEVQLESEEEGNGDDGSPESSAAALSAAPRLRPRTRGRRGA